jgi:hypothetical protein
MTKTFHRVVQFTIPAIAFWCFLFFTACDQERDPCLQPTSFSVRIGCYTPPDTGTIPVDTALPNIIVGALDNDSAIYWIVGADNISKFELILNPQADSCRWFIRPDSAVNVVDTLSFYYDRRLQFISNACGYSYYYSLQRVNSTRHSIDSVKIKDADVNNNANTEHVQIYY